MLLDLNLLDIYNFNNKVNISYANSNINFYSNSYKVLTRMLIRMKPFFKVGLLNKDTSEKVYCLLDTNLFNEIILKLARTNDYTVISVPSQFDGSKFSSAYRYEFEEEIVIQYIHNDIIVIVNKKDKLIVVLGNDLNSLAIETRAIIKDNIIQRKEESLGSCIFHASSFVFEDKGYVVVGKKGAGKTTTIFSSLLLLEDSQFVSNDFVFIDNTNKFHGWPEPIGISPFTCEYFNMDKEFFNGLQKSNEKYIIPYREIPDRFHRDLSTGHNLDYILIPYCDFEKKTTINKMESSKAKDTLIAECRSPFDPSRPHWIEFIDYYGDNSKQIIENISKEVPIFELRIGYDFKESFNDILRATNAKQLV